MSRRGVAIRHRRESVSSARARFAIARSSGSRVSYGSPRSMRSRSELMDAFGVRAADARRSRRTPRSRVRAHRSQPRRRRPPAAFDAIDEQLGRRRLMIPHGDRRDGAESCGVEGEEVRSVERDHDVVRVLVLGDDLGDGERRRLRSRPAEHTRQRVLVCELRLGARQHRGCDLSNRTNGDGASTHGRRGERVARGRNGISGRDPGHRADEADLPTVRSTPCIHPACAARRPRRARSSRGECARRSAPPRESHAPCIHTRA